MEYRSYPEYLESAHWQFTREKILERDKYVCVLCPKVANHVHHINYRQWLNVHDEDLISICEECHCKVHHAIDNGYIPMNNKSSLEMTKRGLIDWQEQKTIGLEQKKSRSRFILSIEFCQKLDGLNLRQKELLRGVFKHSVPKTFRIFQGKSVSKKVHDKIMSICRMLPRPSHYISISNKKYRQYMKIVWQIEGKIKSQSELSEHERHIYDTINKKLRRMPFSN